MNKYQKSLSNKSGQAQTGILPALECIKINAFFRRFFSRFSAPDEGRIYAIFRIFYGETFFFVHEATTREPDYDLMNSTPKRAGEPVAVARIGWHRLKGFLVFIHE